MKVCKQYHFSSAHYLPKVSKDHKCRYMHGHNYKVEVIIEGKVLDDGFVIDFGDIDKLMKPVIKELDHKTLNHIKGLENPTAENLVLWIKSKLPFSCMVMVRVWETHKCYAED